MSTRPRQRLSPRQRRGAIVATALEVFATRDPATVTMDRLAAETQTSPALIYHYFGNKQNLAIAALNAAADELIDRLTRDPSLTAADQLDRGLTTYLDYVTSHPSAWSALLTANASADDPVAAIARRVDDHALGIAVHALGTDPPPAALGLSLRAWLDYVKRACAEWLVDPALTRTQLHAMLATAFVGAVQAATTADPECRQALDVLLGTP